MKHFVISEEDVERSSTLDETDIGKPAVVMNGCIEVRDTIGQIEALIKVIEFNEKVNG